MEPVFASRILPVPDDLPTYGTHLEEGVPPPTRPAPPPPAGIITGGGPWVLGPYVSVQTNIDGLSDNIPGDAANEPSIAVDPNDPDRIVIGWRQFDTVADDFREGGWAYSHDGGQTWTYPGVLEEGIFRSDPVLDVGSDGTFYYMSLQGNFTNQLFISFDGGVTWPIKTPAFGGDKQWITVDRSGGIGHGNIYSSWSTATGGNQIFTRSTDGGLSFMTPITIPQTPVWGTLTVGPDGELYVVGSDSPSSGEDVIRLSRSDDAQNPAVTPSFSVNSVIDLGGTIRGFGDPNPDGLLGQVWVDCDRSLTSRRGFVYVLCSVNPDGVDPLDVHFVRSEDGGVTFSEVVRVNDDVLGTGRWQWFGTLGVAPNGRIDAIWNDTRNDPNGSTSELFYAYSEDGGDTWSLNEPVSLPFDHSLGYPGTPQPQEKLGDYYDVSSDNAGVNVAYAATFNGEQDVYYLRIGPRLGDYNGDAAYDLLDLASLQNCFSDEVPTLLSADCDQGDVQGDHDIDLADFAWTAARLTGPANP